MVMGVMTYPPPEAKDALLHTGGETPEDSDHKHPCPRLCLLVAATSIGTEVKVPTHGYMGIPLRGTKHSCPWSLLELQS